MIMRIVSFVQTDLAEGRKRVIGHGTARQGDDGRYLRVRSPGSRVEGRIATPQQPPSRALSQSLAPGRQAFCQTPLPRRDHSRFPLPLAGSDPGSARPFRQREAMRKARTAVSLSRCFRSGLSGRPLPFALPHTRPDGLPPARTLRKGRLLRGGRARPTGIMLHTFLMESIRRFVHSRSLPKSRPPPPIPSPGLTEQADPKYLGGAGFSTLFRALLWPAGSEELDSSCSA